MRKHCVSCQVSGDKSAANIQNEINIYTALYIKEYLGEKGLTKEEKINIIDELINKLKVSDMDKERADSSSI